MKIDAVTLSLMCATKHYLEELCGHYPNWTFSTIRSEIFSSYMSFRDSIHLCQWTEGDVCQI